MALRLIRLRPGLASESARVVHLTDIDGELCPWNFEDLPGTVKSTAGTLPVLCGLLLIPGTYDILPTLSGMPCESCAIKSPGPEQATPRQLAG